MANTHSNLTPADDLAAIAALRDIIAAGVARYQESLPEDARDPAPFIGLPDHARSVAELPEPEPIINLNEETQRQLCLDCSLDDCVGVESNACPIRIEQIRRWRETEQQRKAEKETINADMRHL